MPARSGCTKCGLIDDRVLFARISEDRCLCWRCWKRAGKPHPRGTLSELEMHENMLAIRKKMTARGGTGRHLVRVGKT